MGFQKGTFIELTIDRIAYGGSGVARHDGLVIFVRGAIPGDRIMAQVSRRKKAYAEARIIELLDPSPDRIVAPCPYSGQCGGCQWQHVRYERQLEYKKEHVRDALARIGAVSGVPVHDPVPSEKIFAYRNKMEFSFADQQWFLPEKKGDDKAIVLGLHVPGTFYKVIDVETCLLQEERGNEILRYVKTHAKESGLPAYGLKTHKGFWRFLTLRHSSGFHEWMVNIITFDERRAILEPLAQAITSTYGDVKTVVNNITTRRAAVAVGEKEIVLSGRGIIQDRLGPYVFQVSANSFFQTNSSAAVKLYQQVSEYAELKGSEIVLDLYSGTGTIPVFLAKSSKQVIAMEISTTAVQDGERNCGANGIENCRFVLGDIGKSLASLNTRPDVLVIDPPRAGMHQDVLARVMELSAERIVYVSCNPATLARDLEEMSQDYEVIEVQPVDMFPHTFHIEAVAKLQRRKRSKLC
jgi:23S rRNA (uracil1939-C5)-methyltransferase